MPVLLLVKVSAHQISTESLIISMRHFLTDTLWAPAHTIVWNSPHGIRIVNVNELKRILIILCSLLSPFFKDLKVLRKCYMMKTPEIIKDVNKHACQLRQYLLISLFLVFGGNFYNW